jgi:hypothetical protein
MPNVCADFKFCEKILRFNTLGGKILMKTIYKNLALGMLLAVFAVFSVAPVSAQTTPDKRAELYNTYMENYNKSLDKQKIALAAAKEYVEKYPEDKEQVDYFKAAIPTLEKGINDKEAADAGAKKDAALFEKFNAANKAKNIPEIFTSGKEILAKQPDFLDINLVLASAGFDQAVLPTPVDTYNNDTINSAKAAIQQIEANKPSATGDYGAINYIYRNDKFTDTKSNALGWMNYTIGYITYYRQGKDNAAKKKEALPYFYKATQYNSFNKNNPFVYQTIGAWYLDEAIKIDTKRKELIKAAGDKDTDETLAMLAEQKGYADRAIDAYARAYKFAKDDPKQKKEYTDNLYSRLKELYTFRYEGKTEGIDQFVATVQNKPMPDPTTAITPVKEETPAATTTSTTNNVTTPATTTPTKPATTNTAKPAATTTPTKPVSMTNTTPAADATAKAKGKAATPKKKTNR